jgi:pyruvate/2-oxoacid:ferredoxin oxidoreductase alpha subunit
VNWINWTALGQIVVVGLIAGAGLPALFAVGLRALSMPGNRTQTAGADSDSVVGGSVIGMAIAAVCFAIVLAAIGWGIFAIYQAGH